MCILALSDRTRVESAAPLPSAILSSTKNKGMKQAVTVAHAVRNTAAPALKVHCQTAPAVTTFLHAPLSEASAVAAPEPGTLGFFGTAFALTACVGWVKARFR